MYGCANNTLFSRSLAPALSTLVSSCRLVHSRDFSRPHQVPEPCARWSGSSSQLALNICQANREIVRDDLWRRRHTIVVQWAEVSSYDLEETIHAVSQSLHITIVELISQAIHQPGSTCCLARDDLDVVPPIPWVTGAQSLHLCSVILPLQCPCHSLYSIPTQFIHRCLSVL